MPRLTGENTGNLAVPKFSQYDDVTKAALNEMIDKFDTRINIVADETQALVAHEADTTNIHGITNTANLLATADTPADGEVLTYTTAGGVNWAAAAGGGGASSVVCQLVGHSGFAITANFLNSPAQFVSWNTATVNTNSMYNASYPTRIVIPETGLYDVSVTNLTIYHDSPATVYLGFHVYTDQAGSTFRAEPYRFGYVSDKFSEARNGPHSAFAKIYCTAGESIALGIACNFTSGGTTKNLVAPSNPNGQYGTAFTVAKL